MAKRTILAVVCVVLSVHATAWGQGPGYALQGPYGPYGPPAGAWPGGQGVMQASYQPGAMPPGAMPPGMMPGDMSQGPMQPEQMQAGPAGEAESGDGPCCGNSCIPSWEFFGDFLYLRPRSANVAYGVVFSGPYDTAPTVATPIQVAQPGTASIDYHPGWRVGFAKSLDECNAVVATFSHYEGEDQDGISTNQFLIRSMVSQPSTWTSNAASDFLQANSDYQMIYSTADVDFRWTYQNQDGTRLNLFAGARYVSLDQRLDVLFTSTDIQDVHSQVNFEGGGLRVGWEGQRRTPYGLLLYGRAAGSLVGGTFRCAYTQTSGLFGPLVETGYPADRVVPIVDLELGTGLSLWNDKLHVLAGYTFSGWFNVVRTDQFIGAVQSNNFTGMSSTLTFDGFFGRVELQF